MLPEYGIKGFKAIFQEAIKSVNAEVSQLSGSAKIYTVFPRNADRKEIYDDTRNLAEAMGMDTNIDLDKTFDEHHHIFSREKSIKNEDQWQYMKRLGFHQEYFEQVMSYFHNAEKTEVTRANPEGIFASATPGDKA